MPTPTDTTWLFSDPGFRYLSRDRQAALLADYDPDFAAKSPGDRVLWLGERVPANYDPPEGRMARAAYSGLQASAAAGGRLAANLFDLIGARRVGGHLAARSDMLAGLAAEHQAEEVPEILARVGGALPLGIATAVAASSAAGPVAGFAGLGVLGAAHKGPWEILKEGGIGAALGALFPATRALSRPERAAILGAAGTAATPGELPPAERLTEGAVFGALGAIPAAHPRPAVVPEGRVAPEAERVPIAARRAVAEAEATERPSPAEEAKALAEGRPAAPPAPLYSEAQALGELRATYELRDPGGDVIAELPRLPELPAQAERLADREPFTLPESLEEPWNARTARPEQLRGIPMEAPENAAEANVAGYIAGPNWQGAMRVDPARPLPSVLSKLVGRKEPFLPLLRAFGIPLREGPLRGVPATKRRDLLGYARVVGAEQNVPGKRPVKGPAIHPAERFPFRGGGRVKTYGDFNTIPHEFAHLLADKYPVFRETYAPAAWKDHLTKWLAGNRGGSLNDYFASADQAGLPWVRELHSLSYDVRSIEEGFAEYNRLWYTQPDKAHAFAPEFTARFEAAKERLPKKQRQAMDQARETMQAYRTQGALAGLYKAVGPEGETEMQVLWGADPSLKNLRHDPRAVWDYLRHRFRQGWVDDFDTLAKAQREVFGESNPELGQSLEDGFRHLRSVGEITRRMVEWGAPHWRSDGSVGAAIDRGGSLPIEAFDRIFSSEAERLRFGAYWTARQALELRTQAIDKVTGRVRRATAQERAAPVEYGMTRESRLSDQNIKAGIDLADQEPIPTPTGKRPRADVYAEAEKILKGFRDDVNEFSVQSGTLSSRQIADFERWRPDYLFGFFREMEAPRLGDAGKPDPLAAASGYYKLRGSTRNLRDWLRNWTDTYSRIVALGFENKAKLDLVDAFRQHGEGFPGRFLEKIEPSANVIRVKLDTFKDAAAKELSRIHGVPKKIARAIVDQAMPDQAAATRIALFVGNGRPFGDNVLTVLRGGEPEYYQIDPMLGRSFAAIHRHYSLLEHRPIRWWAASRRWFQKIITSTPGFAFFSNPVRDVQTSFLNRRTTGSHLTSAMRALQTIVREDASFRDFTLNGGGGGTLREPPELLARRLRLHAARTGHDPQRYLLTAVDTLHFVKLLDRAGHALELVQRKAEFDRARSQGFSPKRAGIMAREVSVDFTRGGDHPLARFLMDVVPFLRARTAGLDRAYRSVLTDPNGKAITALKITAGIGLSAALYELWRRLDPEGFDRDPDWHKYVYYGIPVPVGVKPDGKPDVQLFYLPRAQELAPFERSFEMMLDRMYDSDDPYEKNLAAEIGKIMLAQTGIDLESPLPFPIPVGAHIVAEQALNKNLLTGAPIESELDPKAPWLRARPSTGAWLRDLAKQTESPVSPARADAVLNGVFGEWYRIFSRTLDRALYPGVEPHIDDLPILSRLMTRPGKYDRNQQLFFERYRIAEEIRGTVRELLEQGEIERARQLQTDPVQATKAAMLSPFAHTRRSIDKLNDQIRAIEEGRLSRSKSPREKRDEIDRLTKARNELYAEMVRYSNRAVRQAERAAGGSR